ncbi:malate synthase [Nakamurella panacisegetis]|uniref:Malate synthase n=1 Tax=Nakamurella panacisegetis TaxID=1090615 RepID=A0A1H0J8F1_9ACTN|nr:malate synthase A [Nakamurella panacisegetis]SDO39810.1 malate synthase [Nakamurella panacisegetis]
MTSTIDHTPTEPSAPVDSAAPGPSSIDDRPAGAPPARIPAIRGPQIPRGEEILTPDALAFVAALDGAFAGRRAELLAQRRARAKRISAGETPGFLGVSRSVRADPSWQVAPPAPGLIRRRVEITGPPTVKMTINALNSGADVWMADLEDSTAPTWENIISGQLNLFDAIRGQLSFTEGGKDYRVGERTPTVLMRPRGWHLCEKHLTIDGRPLPASLVDFGLYFWHNARELIARGAGPYFYLPKLESQWEARLWNDVFVLAQDLLGIPQATIRATVLIETLPAAFEMEEILYELRDHSAGLNAGRWDYIFSYIRTFAHRGPEFVLPDRSEITMTTPFMRAYTELLVATCHRRGAHAIGGMAAFVPNRQDEGATKVALAKVRADKQREAADGFDGSWVAHPGLVPVAAAAFEAVLGERPHQIARQRPEVKVQAADLLDVGSARGAVTQHGLRTNISVALRYLAAWVGGSGAVALDNLMEDAATVEISRAQVWQWIHNGVRLAEGPTVTVGLVRRLLDEELARLGRTAPDPMRPRLAAAADIFAYAALGETMPGFFTQYGYVKYLLESGLRMTGELRPEDLRMSERV